MEINLTEIIVAVIGVCSALITGFLIPYIQKNASAKAQENIKFWTGIAVQAAESIYSSGQGAEKKKYVLNYLAEKGIKVDDAQVEAAVYELINGFSKEIVLNQTIETTE